MEAVYIIWMHFLADFIAQGPNMIAKKTDNVWWMIGHCVIYSMFFLYLGGWQAVLIIGVTHFMVDYYAAKLMSWCWETDKEHALHVALGLDQVLHLTVLAILFF